MGRVAILKIRNGDFDQGFDVSLQVCSDNNLPSPELLGRLPANTEMEDLYTVWQQTFIRLRKQRGSDDEDDWQIEPRPTNRSTSEVDACRYFVRNLETSMRNWLQNSQDVGWQRIRERLVRELANKEDEFRVIITAINSEMCKLPWHIWDLMESHPDVEIAFSYPNAEKPEGKKTNYNNQVRILAVLGNSRGINTKPDEDAIKQLNDAKPEFLHQPTSRELIRCLRQQEGWDIFFFAGHSQKNGEIGRIDINESESLEISDFKNALREAIRYGLKLAIFNSCDGLGLAQQLADLHIPVIIVMRERVPDKVAQSFLREFLTEYAHGQPLYTSVRRARERLEEFQDLPGATWLPVICQNLGEVPPTWQKMCPNNLDLLKPPVLLRLGAITLILSLLLFLVELVRLQSAGFTCGPSLKTYRVTKPSGNTAEGLGVRCVKFGKEGGNIQNGLPVFSWYGEGKWGESKYRHLGHAFARDTDTFTGYAADFFRNEGETEGIFDGTLRITFSIDRAGTIPKKITVKGLWDEEWKLEENNNVEDYRRPFLNTEISTCGRLKSGFIEEPITDSVVRCTLKFQPQAPLRTLDYFTWYEEGKRHGFNYVYIGTLDGSKYEISAICKRAKFIGDCQIKRMFEKL